MVEFDIRQQAGYRLLARSCKVEEIEMRLLRELLSADQDRGLLASSEPGVSAVGATLVGEDGPIYVAGVPAEAASVEGYEEYEEIDVPGGRYAFVTYSGDEEFIAQVLAVLREAVSEAGDALTGESIELYRGFDEENRPVMQLGLRLAEP